MVDVFDRPLCCNCRFWQITDIRDRPIDSDGECRFNPPVVVRAIDTLNRDYLESFFPTTGGDEWCGKLEPADG